MSLPRLLLVDDSEAILAYERAALSGLYDLTTAQNGEEALQRIRQERPDGVILDLSMPKMSGDEVLAHLQADPLTRTLPVIIVSSERQRAEACLLVGAVAYLPKPIRADELKALVGRVLDQARVQRHQGGLHAISVTLGPLEIAVPLSCVETVLLYPATQKVPAGAGSYVKELVDFHGQPVFVLDLARPLHVQHLLPVVDRKLLVVNHESLRLALAVDRVLDMEEYAAAEVTWREKLVGAGSHLVGEALLAMIATRRGPVPVIDPRALYSKRMLSSLPRMLESAAAAVSATAAP